MSPELLQTLFVIALIAAGILIIAWIVVYTVMRIYKKSKNKTIKENYKCLHLSTDCEDCMSAGKCPYQHDPEATIDPPKASTD